ncbi:hypothetical protein [Halorussus litoreus]|uniref:hypothetical protein n=1 Tax=Halorussus litoreus TaxID=1710536 RepID=UPI000E27449C|nr:hypothetical protein [Halorussus litoreus]
MVPRTRRRLLSGAAALLTGLAGCSRSSVSDSSDAPPGSPRGENVERDPDRVDLRAPDEQPPVWLPRDEDETATESTTAGRPERARSRGLVASASVAERLGIADVDGAGEAREFVSDTDFEAETLYVESRSVEECRSPELCYVAWSATEVETQFGGRYRDADTDCRVDERDGVSWLIRIPDMLDPDRVSSHGSGWSSRGCDERRRIRERENGTTTEPPNLGPATSATETTDSETSDTTTEDER